MQVSTATAAELIAFFNANTGGNPVKKFADRKTAERRVQALLDEMAAEQPVVTAQPVAEGACSECGATTDITSGRVVEHGGKQTIVDEGYFTCHGCGHEWGTKDTHYVRVRGDKPVVERPAMAASLKLDRQILSVNSGIVYKNACQVWKQGLVSAAQGDRLSAVLYGAAKQGNRLMSVSINGHVFTLAVK